MKEKGKNVVSISRKEMNTKNVRKKDVDSEIKQEIIRLKLVKKKK